MLGIVTLSTADDGTVNVSLGAATDEALQRIKPLIDLDGLKARANGKRTLDDFSADISQTVETVGLLTEELPPGDLQIEMVIDTKSGRMVSSQKALHPYASIVDDLVSNAHQSLAVRFAGIPSKVAGRISAATAAGDHEKATAEVEAAANEGHFGFAPNVALLDALASIDLNAIDAKKKELVRQCLMVTAHKINRMNIASEQAEFLMKETTGLTDIQKADLEMVIAHGAIDRGQVETAMSIWRRLLKIPGALVAESRGWAWRNISVALGPTNPETMEAARHSAGSFLEAGNKEEAGRSMMVLAKALLHRSPKDAIQVLNEIEALSEQEGLRNIELRAALFHARGNRLSALGDHQNALDDALKSVDLRRGLIGTEPELISSLYLVQQELNQLGRHDEAKAYGAEANHLSEKTNDPHFQLVKRVTNLIENFDAKEAAELLGESRKVEDHEVTAAVQTLQATLDPSLSDTQRLSQLEACLAEQAQKNLSDGAKAPARQALVQQLMRMGQLDRAEGWLKRILSANPLDQESRNILVDVMWKREEWGDAAIFLRKQIELWGEMPGLNLALGKSLLKSGNLNEAVQVLTKASHLAGQNIPLKEQALRLREEVLQMGGTVLPRKPSPTHDAVVSREDFEQALSEFRAFVQADKRMTFWKRADDDHEWIPHPERHAQDLLHTFLKGRFGERISVYEEITAGAGRLDIYVQLHGGLSVVVELKMCGFRYSSSYAASGEEQVLHYMQNRGTYLGYLVVFDARLNDYGNKLLPNRPANECTVVEIFCDVRPRVSMRGTRI